MMKILCDTHILIWFLTGDDRLSVKARTIIENEENEIYFSLVSVWEINIKHSRKPKQMSLSPKRFIELCESQGFLEYPIEQRHILALDTLHRPVHTPEHHDPFDKLLLSQAKIDQLIFVTHDALIPDYNEPCIVSV